MNSLMNRGRSAINELMISGIPRINAKMIRGEDRTSASITCGTAATSLSMNTGIDSTNASTTAGIAVMIFATISGIAVTNDLMNSAAASGPLASCETIDETTPPIPGRIVSAIAPSVPEINSVAPCAPFRAAFNPDAIPPTAR